MNSFIGIDNGVSGALAVIHSDGSMEAFCMPLQRTRKGIEVDVIQVKEILRAWRNKHGDDMTVVIEEPGGSKSAKAATSMAGAFHAVRAVVELMRFKLVRVTPAAWQKKVLNCKAGDTKPVALQLAKSLWPQFDFRATDRCKVQHDGKIDAMLLARFAQQNNL